MGLERRDPIKIQNKKYEEERATMLLQNFPFLMPEDSARRVRINTSCDITTQESTAWWWWGSITDLIDNISFCRKTKRGLLRGSVRGQPKNTLPVNNEVRPGGRGGRVLGWNQIVRAHYNIVYFLFFPPPSHPLFPLNSLCTPLF